MSLKSISSRLLQNAHVYNDWEAPPEILVVTQWQKLPAEAIFYECFITILVAGGFQLFCSKPALRLVFTHRGKWEVDNYFPDQMSATCFPACFASHLWPLESSELLFIKTS